MTAAREHVLPADVEVVSLDERGERLELPAALSVLPGKDAPETS